MGYGARAQRKPALGGASLSDVDINKIGLVCKTERGIVTSGGLTQIMDEIYSMNDFEDKCGLYNSSYYGAYVAKNFFDELLREVSVEMKVLNFVESTAVQAGYDIMDSDGTPEKIFDCDAGYMNMIDKSAFGNKIAIKTLKTQNITMKLAANILALATSAVLDNVDNLRAGYVLQFVEGATTEDVLILTVTAATKTITFAATVNPFTAAGTTVYRYDWDLTIGVKDSLGNYQTKEEWKGYPFTSVATEGMAGAVNDPESGSKYVILTVNGANGSVGGNKVPANLTTWTPMTLGSDGVAPTDSDWDTLVDTYFTSADVTIMLAPESTSVAHNNNMADFSTQNYRCMYYTQSANNANEATLKNFGASLRRSIVFSMAPGDKWIKVYDPITQGYKDIPKVGMDAAHWFNTYYKFGESKVAAGNKSEMVFNSTVKLNDGNGLVHDDELGVGGRLIRNYSINICRYRRGIGITNNSARTFSTDDGYKFQNQIMQWILYKKSILAYLRQVEQDRSGGNVQETHRNNVWAYMKAKFDAGHLYSGRKEDGSAIEFKDVCIIVNDFTNNTLVNINNGIEETFLQFVAPPPIEEPVLSLASAGVTTIRA